MKLLILDLLRVLVKLGNEAKRQVRPRPEQQAVTIIGFTLQLEIVFE